ncbi:MAG: hypothetical protein WDZ85_03770 [Candidatus Paceibacterota bacterium]
MQSTLLIAGIISFIIAGAIVGWRLIEIRRGAVFPRQPALWPMIDHWLDVLAFFIVTGSKSLLKQSYLILLIAGEKLIKLFKYLILRVERRFTRVVNQVKGRHDISKRGSASLFLREIKRHQENWQNGNGA